MNVEDFLVVVWAEGHRCRPGGGDWRGPSGMTAEVVPEHVVVVGSGRQGEVGGGEEQE